MFPFGAIIVVCWIIFWLYWFISAFDSKKNVTPNFDRFVGARLLIVIVAIVLFRFIGIQNYSFDSRAVSHNEIVLTVGFILFLLGLLLAVWARLYLGKNWGMPMSQKENPELVTDGPYRYIRHPIYSGILLAILGSTITSSFYWFVVFVIIGIYFIYSAVMEEKLMTKEFPKVYPSYKSKTKMLIPFIF